MKPAGSFVSSRFSQRTQRKYPASAARHQTYPARFPHAHARSASMPLVRASGLYPGPLSTVSIWQKYLPNRVLCESLTQRPCAHLHAVLSLSDGSSHKQDPQNTDICSSSACAIGCLSLVRCFPRVFLTLSSFSVSRNSQHMRSHHEPPNERCLLKSHWRASLYILRLPSRRRLTRGFPAAVRGSVRKTAPGAGIVRAVACTVL